MNNIVFFSDRNMLPGLHSALASLIVSFKGELTEVIVFCDNIAAEEKRLISQTWWEIQVLYRANLLLSVRDMPAIALPEGTATLHGNITTYGRLFLGEWLDQSVEKVVYLDADLIIQMNVQLLFDAIHEDYTLVADGYSARKHSWDKELYALAELPMDEPCFNAGVLGINLKRWRQMDCMAGCYAVMRAYGSRLKSADQSVLNILCAFDFVSLGKGINFPLYSNSEYHDYGQPCIYHFVGSPKPFDAFGKYVHRHYPLWYSYYQSTAIRNRSMLQYTSWKRLVNIRRSFIRAFINM